MMGLMEAALLLGLAAGPDDEALADLERRTGGISESEKRQQEDPKPQRPDAPLQTPVASGPEVVDFEWLELHVRAGMAIFSKDFHIDPSPCFVIEGRVPVLWLAPSDNPEGDYLGVWAELGMAVIKRTITPSVAKPSGAMISLSVGLDYTIYRDATWVALVRAGVQYATYGGVTDLKDGMAPLLGVTVGVSVTRSVSITFSPEYILGKGDSIIFGTVGVMIDF